MLSGISVVICCYNSESKIQKTLEHIINQKRIIKAFIYTNSFRNKYDWEVFT